MATFVLVPGAGGDPWDWHRLVPLLEEQGHDVVRPRLPAGDPHAGFDAYAAAVLDAMAATTAGRSRRDAPTSDDAALPVGAAPTASTSLPRPLVVVGHSMGGFTAPVVAERASADLLVLLNAMVPRPGETGGAWWDAVGFAGEDEADGSEDPFFHDLPPALAAEARARDAEQTEAPFRSVWPLDGWPDIPVRVIAGQDERFFPVALQQRVARERLGVEPELLPGGHMLALSQPEALAERLLSYVVGSPAS